jgi:hypothetical protein
VLQLLSTFYSCVLLLRGPTAAAGIGLRCRNHLHHFELFCNLMGCYILLTSLLHVAAAAPCCPLLAVPFRRPLTRQAKPHASSSTSSVCILACVDPFTHARAIDPCPLPSTAVAGTRQGASAWQQLLCRLCQHPRAQHTCSHSTKLRAAFG